MLETSECNLLHTSNNCFSLDLQAA